MIRMRCYRCLEWLRSRGFIWGLPSFFLSKVPIVWPKLFCRITAHLLHAHRRLPCQPLLCLDIAFDVRFVFGEVFDVRGKVVRPSQVLSRYCRGCNEGQEGRRKCEQRGEIFHAPGLLYSSRCSATDYGCTKGDTPKESDMMTRNG